MQPPAPSSPNLESNRPGADTSAAWRAMIEGRMTDLEERLSGSGGPEPSIKNRLEELQDGRAADSRSLATLLAAVGESPDAATGRDGSGMRKQLAALVEAGKKPTIASYVAAIGTGLLALYQVLKGFGVLH